MCFALRMALITLFQQSDGSEAGYTNEGEGGVAVPSRSGRKTVMVDAMALDLAESSWTMGESGGGREGRVKTAKFPVQGEHTRVPNFRTVSYASSITQSARRYALEYLDLDDSQTDLANLGGPGAAGSAAAGDKLWEDNWDADDIEEEFSTQLRFFVFFHPAFASWLKYHPFLRSELEKTKSSSDAMQH
jgi:hypothetical protein